MATPSFIWARQPRCDFPRITRFEEPITLTLEAKAHGLDGSLVEPDWPPLTHDEVASVLTRYRDLQPPLELLSISQRPFSAASVVHARNRRVFMKRHFNGVRDADGLREEHRFMAHLRSHGASVPEVFREQTGDTIVGLDEWTYEVHSVPAGVDTYEDAISWTPFRSVVHAKSAGEMLAKLHLAAHGYEAPARCARQLVAGFTIFAGDQPAKQLDRYLALRPALVQYLQQSGSAEKAMGLLAPFHEELAPLLPYLAQLWTHNDLHASNLFWSDVSANARATAVIDFGLCDRTNAVYDLAHAIERNVVEWLVLVNDQDTRERVPIHMDHLWALLDGYEAVRPLSAAEAAALAPMLALCHAEFALSEADYFLSILHSQEKAYMACEGYLLSHAQYWHRAGVPMLDNLRQWASSHSDATGADRCTS
jgi:Ser/Thr protein kinase RdoA (MazF antagonist)